MAVTPIGVIHTPFDKPAGMPIQSALAEGAEGTVEVFPQYAAGLKDIGGFERIWLVYWLHKAGPANLIVRPFLQEVQRGLFAVRAPRRPNPIGMSPVRLLRVEGTNLHVADVDILDGTPLLDIKPYVPQFDSFPQARAGWVDDAKPSQGTLSDDRFSGR